MNNASIEKQQEAGQPPPYHQPPIATDTFSPATTGYSMSTRGPQTWPCDPPSYSNGFITSGPFDGQQQGIVQYQLIDNTEASGSLYGRPFQHQPQTIVINQPVASAVWGQGLYGPLADPPQDYMCYSIFVTLCCCWLIGIFAIMRSSECRAAIAAGDRTTAEIKSREARSKAHLALVLGVVSAVVSVVIVGLYYGLIFKSSYG